MSEQTKAEEKAGVMPKDVSYPPGDIRRYGGKLGKAYDSTELLANRIAEMEINRMAMANWIGPKERPNG